MSELDSLAHDLIDAVYARQGTTNRQWPVQALRMTQADHDRLEALFAEHRAEQDAEDAAALARAGLPPRPPEPEQPSTDASAYFLGWPIEIDDSQPSLFGG